MTSPKILIRVDGAGACSPVKGAHIVDPDLAAKQIVDMDVDFRRGIDRDGDILVPNNILRNDGSTNRGAAPPLLMLIPVVPAVAVSSPSGPLPEMKLPMIWFSDMLSAGAPNAGPTCVCRATPGIPFCVSSLWMITLRDTRPGPCPSEKMPATAPPTFTPFLATTFSPIVL